MDAPQCNEHSRLVLDLALGRLDDNAAERAETALQSCPVCRSWWSQHMESPAAQVVAAAVSEELTRFQAPSQRRHWWAMAAAVLLTLAVVSLWQLAPGGPVTTMIGSSTQGTIPASQPAEAVINTISFEPENLGTLELVMESEAASKVARKRPADSPLFAIDFETGSLNGWSPTT